MCSVHYTDSRVLIFQNHKIVFVLFFPGTNLSPLPVFQCLLWDIIVRTAATIQHSVWWFRLQTDGLLPEFYLSPPSSKVITGRACIIQWKSGFRLLSGESGLMSLPHHFPHRSLRTVSQRGVRRCKHPTAAVISFLYMQHLFCHSWSDAINLS